MAEMLPFRLGVATFPNDFFLSEKSVSALTDEGVHLLLSLIKKKYKTPIAKKHKTTGSINLLTDFVPGCSIFEAVLSVRN
jgi:hypothetical protein